MDGMTITIDTREMDEALSKLPLKVSGKIARNALQAAGDVVLGAMVALCPERTDGPTPGSDALAPGVLRESLNAQVVTSKTDAPRVKIGPAPETQYVGWWIENGFTLKSHGRSKASRHAIRAIPGKHFMAAAFDESIEKAVDVMLENIGSALGQESTEGVGPENDHDYGEV